MAASKQDSDNQERYLDGVEVKTMQETLQATPSATQSGKPLRIEPDLQFIQALREQAGDSYKRCFQCGTCSGTCALSTNSHPFPRKEMAWAVWGLRDRLLADPDVWLCHQCSDCSERCPRGSRPGEVLSAVRRECVLEYSAPRFLARWVNDPVYLPFLLAIPAVLLSLLLTLKGPIEGALGIARNTTDRIVFSYTPELPHWLLNTFFFTFSFLALLGAVIGVRRFWKALQEADAAEGKGAAKKGLGASFWTVVKSTFTHEKFAECTHSKSRYASHFLVFFGCLALCLVTFWVITSRYNPLFADGFVYPLNFWDPWKVLANLGGTALIIGCAWMGVNRLWGNERTGPGTFFDWSLLSALFLVVASGFATEVLHYIRLEPHRHAVYFIHLILVFYLLVYLPYSKLAHVIYRTVALVYNEHTGRHDTPAKDPAGGDR